MSTRRRLRASMFEAALSKQQIAAVAWLAVGMNGWNRIAIASHYPVGP